jgi:hypothetical protein
MGEVRNMCKTSIEKAEEKGHLRVLGVCAREIKLTLNKQGMK